MEPEVTRRGGLKTDVVSGLILLLIGIYVAWEAARLPFGTVRQPDSGFFPLLIAIALILSSAVILAGAAIRDRGVPVRFSRQTAGAAVAVLVLIAYVLVLEPIGYVLATFATMAIFMRGIERLSWRVTVLVSLPLVIGSYALFRWLGVPLPSGILPL